MVKAVIFDFGNVIYRFDRRKFVAKLSRLTEKPAEDIFSLLYDSDIPRRYEMGSITSEEFYQLACGRCMISLPIESFIDAFNSMFSPVHGMSKLIGEIKKRGYRLGLLSNTNEWHFEHTICRADVFPLFDSVTLSYRVGEMKPNEKIYRDALSRLNLHPADCVYVDDVKNYAEKATAIGMTGIHFTSLATLVKSLASAGVKLHG